MTQDAPWPLPKFRFEVTWDGRVMRFAEVSGLDMEAPPIAFRAGDSPTFSTIRMPLGKKHSDVTMKKGVVRSDSSIWDWFIAMQSNTARRVPVTISLVDEAGQAEMVWTLANAWPVKFTGMDLKSPSDEVAIETIVIAHEGLTISKPGTAASG